MSGRAKTLWTIMEGQRLRYAAAIGAILVAALFMFCRPLIGRVAIDYVISGKDLHAPQPVRDFAESIGGRPTLARNLWIAAVAIVGVTAISGVFSYLKGRWAAQASESIARNLRDKLYDHLQHLPCSYHDKAETGDLIQRCTSDIETIRMFLAAQVVEIGRAIILMAVALPLMLSIDVQMTLVSMAVIPVVIVFGVVFFTKVGKTFKASAEAEGKMTTRLQENLTGIRVVRAFARQDYECKRFAEDNAEYRKRWFRLMRLFSVYWPISNLLCAGQIGAVMLTGAYFITLGDARTPVMTVGGLYAFITFVNMFLWPVRQMGRVLADMGKAMVSLGRIGEILSVQVEADSDARRPAPTGRPTAGRIVIKNLSFAHGDEQEVLRDISVTIEPGRTLAILGPSGSGKSTLINLLLRLYDYESGSIHLDGIELRDLPRKQVRAMIGSVLQEPFLYSKSLRDNIVLGRAGAQEAEMVEATSTAAVHESIVEFDDGYDTLVGERGVTLSGGQRQRVALARALLKDPPILILDDALSAVDTRTESAILKALRRRHEHRTTIVIAHRLTTLMRADRIIVLDEGRIVQEGAHAELAAAEGMYRRLWRIQSSLEEDFDQDLQASAT